MRTQQELITSAKTARPGVPAIFQAVKRLGGWKAGTVNLDLGGGPYEYFTHALAEVGVKNLVWDPYNRSFKHNWDVLDRIFLFVDTCTLSNVLNVICSRADRVTLMEKAWVYLRPGGNMYVTVYEGDKTGVGKSTRDGWQENRRLKTYLSEISQAGFDFEIKGNLIIATARH